MSRYKIRDQHGLNFVTITCVNWIDIFIRKQYKDIIIDSLRYCQAHKGLEVYAYVIMSSHLHLVVRAAGEQTLSEVLRDFKKFTAKTIIKAVKTERYESRREWLLHRMAYNARMNRGTREYQLWQPDNHPFELFSMPIIHQKINYIHQNPVKEGWVRDAPEYLYSSASNYVNGSGILKVNLVDLPLSWIGYISPLKFHLPFK